MKKWLGGLFIFWGGISITALNWYLAIAKGHYYPKASMLGPPFILIGFGLIVFPTYKEERIRRGEDLSSLQGFKLITPRCWSIIIIGLCLGGMNWYLGTTL